jgi:hypothetical protein
MSSYGLQRSPSACRLIYDARRPFLLPRASALLLRESILPSLVVGLDGESLPERCVEPSDD